LLSGRNEDSAAAESFRGLRAALGMAGRAQNARSFLFTGSRAGEGKSCVALNFAASLARQGYRTLLIDANLRAPVLDSVLLGMRSPCGLADYLSGSCAPDAKLCQPSPVANLFLFPAGIPKAHPGEILNEAAFARLLGESLKWFHRVVIDTPSSGQFADALPLARHADAVCLVVRPGLTKRSGAQKTVSRLTAAGGRPAGFVLNAAPEAAVRESFAGETAPPFQTPALLPALPAARA
jgi:capsular exopolysaccharide synthesis family protein